MKKLFLKALKKVRQVYNVVTRRIFSCFENYSIEEVYY